jgi:hypothetical protein
MTLTDKLKKVGKTIGIIGLLSYTTIAGTSCTTVALANRNDGIRNLGSYRTKNIFNIFEQSNRYFDYNHNGYNFRNPTNSYGNSFRNPTNK